MKTLRYDPERIIGNTELLKKSKKNYDQIRHATADLIQAGHAFQIESKPPRAFFYESALEWLRTPGNVKRAGRPTSMRPGSLSERILDAGLTYEHVRKAVCPDLAQSTFRQYVQTPEPEMTRSVKIRSRKVRETVEKYLSINNRSGK